MQRYLDRNAYDQLLKWKQRANYATLVVSGARQVGKTYIVNKFADEQYKRKVYINLLDFTGELFLEKYEDLRNEIKNGLVCENPVYELIRRARPDFEDAPDTIVIIDEIQESAAIYNRIRGFTRQLKSDFIITGSYPAVVLRYLENGSIEDANAELLKIIKLFTNESKRYFNDPHIRNRKARFLTSRALLDTVPTGL